MKSSRFCCCLPSSVTRFVCTREAWGCANTRNISP